MTLTLTLTLTLTKSEREACSALVNALLRACQRPAVENPSASLLEEHAATVDLASQCLGKGVGG